MINSAVLLFPIPQAAYNENIITGKIFEYLASKINIITIGPKGGNADLILQSCERNKAVDYHENDILYQQIKDAIHVFNQNGNIVKQIDNQLHLKYSRKIITKQLSILIK